MGWIIEKLANDFERYPEDDEAGLKQLYLRGLVDENFVRKHDRPELRSLYDRNGLLIHEHDKDGSDHENDADSALTPPYGRQPPRGREESTEEQQLLRRRRREAMVIGGGGRPFALADTTQRPQDGSEDALATQSVEPVAEQIFGQEAPDDARMVAGDDQRPPELQGTS